MACWDTGAQVDQFDLVDLVNLVNLDPGVRVHLFALLSLVRVVNPVGMVHLGGGAGLRVGAAGS